MTIDHLIITSGGSKNLLPSIMRGARKRRATTAGRRAVVLDLMTKNRSLTADELAERCNCSNSLVRRIASENGYKLKRAPQTKPKGQVKRLDNPKVSGKW